MLLPALLCVLALAAAGLSAPRHNADDAYIDQLLRDEMREEYGNKLSQRPTREDFGHFHDRDDYEQTDEQNLQPQSSNLEQAEGAAEQFDQNNDQQQNGAIEQFDQNNDQEQNGAIEQFDQNNDQEQNNDQDQNGAIEQFDQNNDQEQNGAIDFDQNNERAQNGAVEQYDDEKQADRTTEQDQVSHNQNEGRGSGSSSEQDRIHKEAIDRLFGSANADEFRPQEDEHFTDVFGNKPVVSEPTTEYLTEVPVVTKKPSWFHRTWSKTKHTAKHVKDKVGGFFRGIANSVG